MEPEQQPQATPKHQPKIGAPIAFILLAVAVVADLINWIPGVNVVVTALTMGYQLYFWLNGVPGFIGLMGNVIEFIPGASVVPALTAAIGLTIYVDRNPDSWLGQKVSKIAAALQRKKAGVAASVSSQASGMPRIKTPKGALGELAQ